MKKAIGRGNSRRAAAAPALLTHVQSKCPDMLAGAGEGGAFRAAAIEYLDYAWQLSMRPAYLRFARETAHLQWSARQITRDVNRQAKAVMAEVSVAQPDLCAEARAYVASSYQVVPPGTERFLAERRAIESEYPLPSRLNALLLPYERAAGLTPPATPKIVHPDAQERADERAFAGEFEQLLAELGLPRT